jgi:O-acetyl-ADP-ribose deacetylase (regulator of RNase III)
MSFSLLLVDPNRELAAAFARRAKGVPGIEVHPCGFQQLPAFDCLVSPANSFGLMDGGVDAQITMYFGLSLMARVQERIRTEYLGEQPVGTSMIVETGDDEHPFLAHTPTMRVPMVVADSDVPYIATWAMLIAVHRHNLHDARKIRTVACPGLGTGVGQYELDGAARQMIQAYRNYLEPAFADDWSLAHARHARIRRDISDP